MDTLALFVLMVLALIVLILNGSGITTEPVEILIELKKPTPTLIVLKNPLFAAIAVVLIVGVLKLLVYSSTENGVAPFVR